MARSGSYIWITWGWISKIEIEWYFWLYVYFLLIENLFNLICRQRLARLRFASSLRLQRATAPSTTDWNYATLFVVLSGESRKGCQTLCIPFHSRFLPYDLSVFLIPSGTSPRRYGALVLVPTKLVRIQWQQIRATTRWLYWRIRATTKCVSPILYAPWAGSPSLMLTFVLKTYSPSYIRIRWISLPILSLT